MIKGAYPLTSFNAAGDFMDPINPFDLGVKHILREAGILREVDPTAFDLHKGLIVIRCPDGAQIMDRLNDDLVMVRRAGGREFIHPLTDHGGSMAIAPDSPLYPGMGVGHYRLVAISEAMAITGITTVSAEVHLPCKKAGMCGLSLVQQIVLMMAAKPRIKEATGAKVICRVHVDHQDGRKRTYYVSRAAWIRFWHERGRALWGHLFESDPYQDPLPATGVETVFAMPSLPAIEFQST